MPKKPTPKKPPTKKPPIKKPKPWNKKWLLLLAVPLAVAAFLILNQRINLNPFRHIGQPIDSLHGVYVYFNGPVAHTQGRNLAPDGYNWGLRYQCVEFVKRYYHLHLNHKMPDAYGHARDFFDPDLPDGTLNPRRGLRQYTNPSASRPQPDDLLIWQATNRNAYGHVAILSSISDTQVEWIQQNAGSFGSSRATQSLIQQDGRWYIQEPNLIGWLRKEK